MRRTPRQHHERVTNLGKPQGRPSLISESCCVAQLTVHQWQAASEGNGTSTQRYLRHADLIRRAHLGSASLDLPLMWTAAPWSAGSTRTSAKRAPRKGLQQCYVHLFNAGLCKEHSVLGKAGSSIPYWKNST
jgi:hypothetical protein